MIAVTLRHLRIAYYYIGIGCAILAAGCGGTPPTGRVGIALQISPGVSLSSASYTITGPGSFDSTGTVTVGGSSDVPVPVSNLPIGTGYLVSVTGVATDGITTCSGSAGFDVTDAGASTVIVHLVCRQQQTGQVAVSGTVNICPLVDGLAASPAEILVGGTLLLTAAAHDADSGPSPLVYLWSASGGMLSAGGGPNATLTCTAPGTVSVSVSVSDGDATCSNDSLTVTVTCTARTS
jgi:hypothetical protein